MMIIIQNDMIWSGREDIEQNGANDVTPSETENAPPPGKKEKDKRVSDINQSTVSHDIFNESMRSSDYKTRHTGQGAMLQNETKTEDTILRVAVNISNNFLVLGSFHFVKRTFQQVFFLLLLLTF